MINAASLVRHFRWIFIRLNDKCLLRFVAGRRENVVLFSKRPSPLVSPRGHQVIVLDISAYRGTQFTAGPVCFLGRDANSEYDNRGTQFIY
mgnify:CR=1 FL=1